MGLDSYLYMEKQVGSWGITEEAKAETKAKTNELADLVNIKDKSCIDYTIISYAKIAVGYWREVWWLHNFFIKLGGEYDTYIYVPKESIGELAKRCSKVLANHELANSLLPNSGQPYDKNYFDEVELTLELLEKLLKEEEEVEFIYEASY